MAAVLFFAGIYVSPFDWDSGSFPRDPVPVDAIPDIGENQQIVFTKWDGRSPKDVEDQITFPLTSALLGIPGVRTIRSSSAFGFSTIYIIFDDNIDFYWSRSRVLEKLSSLPPETTPAGVTPTLGPDATALGQIFWYTLEGRNTAGKLVGGWDLDELRAVQDWMVRYSLQGVKGVSEVASIGGFVREYQVDVDPEAMRASGVTLGQIANAVKGSNLDIGARTMELNQVEFVIRGLGFVKDTEDIEQAVVVSRQNTPIRVRDVANVSLGPALRRGALDDGGAPAVGGVAVARFMENPLSVINAVNKQIERIQPGLPKKTLANGEVSQVTIVPFYDRTTLIHETLDTLSSALNMEILITIIVVLVMLRDLRSSVLVSGMLPLGVLAAFVVMKLTGVDANIMALGGIAIAIGTMVDIGIVFVENMNQHLTALPPTASRKTAIRRATAEVAPAVVTSVLTTVVSFIPVFGLSSTELRLFAPLAFTKTFAMTGILILSIVILPGAAHIVLRRHPEPITSTPHGVRRVFASIFRSVHIRDWLLLMLGGVMWKVNIPLAAFILLLGLFRICRPLLPRHFTRIWTIAENYLAVIGVSLALTSLWMPIGPENGMLKNGVFVGALIFIVLGGFRLFEKLYPTFLAFFLRHKILFFAIPTFLVVFGLTVAFGFNTVFGFLPQTVKTNAVVSKIAHAFPGLGREYMPPFDEGSFLYMPTTMPHGSIGAVQEMMSEMDMAISQIPEVERVVGKLGRVDSALDPAPVSMLETVITYKPEYRIQKDGTRIRQWRKHIRSTTDIWNEIVAAAERPGITSAPVLMPIGARIVMLQSGMRAPMGIKVQGPNLKSIEAFGMALEKVLKQSPAIRPETVFADRVVGKPYIEIKINREAIARYGLSVTDVQEVLQIALGGKILTRTVEGRERYSVRVRYMREERDSMEALGRITVSNMQGQNIPLQQLADIQYVKGPQVIKSEDTFLTSYVLFDKKPHISEVIAVEKAEALINAKLKSGELQRPDGVTFRFAGTYENQVRSETRLKMLVPLALTLVFILLYLQFKRVSLTIAIYSGVLVAVSGGFILMWLYAQPWFLDMTVFGESMRTLLRVDVVNLSVAVWIGFIALVGIATDDGVVMCTYLQQHFNRTAPTTIEDIHKSTLEAGMRRVRPCLMTTATTLLALIPVITSQGKGADIMMPMALPALGGMAIELLTLFVVPVLYSALEERRLYNKLKKHGVS
ncbi:MAG: efflux RND transporter permease subunit [Deltaproteobacteria bacterium]|nr:efflux RND transporter permease subunit [Deltaproteobacteria bacterium]